MERHFDEELIRLKHEMLRMGAMVEIAIYGSIEALKNLSREEADKVIGDDKKIDEIEILIDRMCLDMLALRQPVAMDLRFITMSMKITTDLERMADLAVDIAQRVLELAGKNLLKPLIDIPKLATLAQEMTRDALNSFLKKDAELAKRVIFCDKEADALRDKVQAELVNNYIGKDVKTTPRAIPLILIARHLERICDHATNIAEDVIYMVSARIVKHHAEDLDTKV